MTRYTIQANAITSTYEADSVEETIKLYVQDSGYETVEEAAEACNQTVEQFLADIHVIHETVIKGNGAR